MAQFVIENLEDDLRDKLQILARDHGHSVVDEIHNILREAVVTQHNSRPELGSRIARCFAGQGLTEEIPELRGQPVNLQSFDR
jgi:plasmid stability protein